MKRIFSPHRDLKMYKNKFTLELNTDGAQFVWTLFYSSVSMFLYTLHLFREKCIFTLGFTDFCENIRASERSAKVSY